MIVLMTISGNATFHWNLHSVHAMLGQQQPEFPLHHDAHDTRMRHLTWQSDPGDNHQMQIW